MRHFAVSVVDWWQACVEAWTQVDGGMERQYRRELDRGLLSSRWRLGWRHIPLECGSPVALRPPLSEGLLWSATMLISAVAWSVLPLATLQPCNGTWQGVCHLSTGGCICMADSRLRGYRAALPGNSLGAVTEVFSG